MAKYIDMSIKVLSENEPSRAEQLQSDKNNVVSKIFENEDRDRDGYISYDEFSGPKKDEL